MPKQENRGSLMDLKKNLPSVPKVSAIHPAPNMEQVNIIEAIEQMEPGRKEASTYVKTLPAEGSIRQPKEPTTLLNANLPVSLHTRLKRTAQFNSVSMTDILIRAIKVELDSGRYTAPPETWGTK